MRRTGLEKAWVESFPRRGKSPWDTEFSTLKKKEAGPVWMAHRQVRGRRRGFGGWAGAGSYGAFKVTVDSSNTVLKALRKHDVTRLRAPWLLHGERSNFHSLERCLPSFSWLRITWEAYYNTDPWDPL